NTVVVLAAEADPLPALALAEVLATSDVPGGVVNILTGRLEPTAALLGSHTGVDALDLTGVDGPLARPAAHPAAARAAVVRRGPGRVDWRADPGTTAMTDLLRTRTGWHPRGDVRPSGTRRRHRPSGTGTGRTRRHGPGGTATVARARWHGHGGTDRTRAD